MHFFILFLKLFMYLYSTEVRNLKKMPFSQKFKKTNYIHFKNYYILSNSIFFVNK
jgi:hypothetical protein